MEVHRTVTEFFHEKVTEALKTEHVEVTEPTEFYLVNLLCDFTRSEKVDAEPLVIKMAQATVATPDERVKALKEVGDTTLYVSGFFADSLTRRLVDVEYYIALGEAAYSQLAGMRSAANQNQLLHEVYGELSQKFPRFVDVLQAIRAGMCFAGGANLIKLCEEWLRTGDEWLERRLRATGVVALDPVDGAGKKIIH
jgi:hypothetical protein